MKVTDLVKFRGDLFFDGAVQLKWTDENPSRAEEAARAFVFHGPKYHGVSKETGADEAYRLTDTATLLSGLLSRIAHRAKSGSVPFSLAIAGYGSGKSHFAVALTELLRNTSDSLSEQILRNLELADNAACSAVKAVLEEFNNPALVVALDGTANFNLGNALSSSIFGQLRKLGIDDSPLRELSPRFEDAASFAKRNFSLRVAEFSSKFSGQSVEEIVASLESRDEDVYSLVDEIYLNANGAHIPIEGRESAQDLIATFCDNYCGVDGPFSRLVIVFDEFGRFLEYVAERPALAGDSALQQIFQGVQDRADKAHFIGFIQYELKAYLARLAHRDAMHIQKYITRFDVAKKYYLSSNLETIIAHLLEKRDEETLDQALATQQYESKDLHSLMSSLLPGFRQLPIWKNFPDFQQIVVKGCWPLHPLAAWFLTRQQDIVQSRSAITFVRTAMEAFAGHEAISGGRLASIPASRIVLGELLTEMLAAERSHGGVAVDNLKSTLDKYAAQLDVNDKYLLVAVTAAKKMRVVSFVRGDYDLLLRAFSGGSEGEHAASLLKLEHNLGVLEWSDELKQYELITDAATRGQYQKDLRKRVREVSSDTVKEIFVGRAKGWADSLLQDVSTSFGQENEIPTLEWTFVSQLANDKTIGSAIELAFSDWQGAHRPDQSKGQLIYAYLDKDADALELQSNAKKLVDKLLKKYGCTKAPIWVVFLADISGRIQDYLKTLYVLEEGFDEIERDRYARFVPEDRESSLIGFRAAIREPLATRVAVGAGVELVGGRLAQEANSIFKDVYSRALPFPFDGFGSKSGNGAADAAAVARALFGKEVSAAWLDVQKVQLQNRVKLLLGRAWGVLDYQGKISSVASNQIVKDLLGELEKNHKKFPGRTLAEDLHYLLMPPYGCNLASAAILLGLLVGRTTPLRAIQYEGQGIGLTDWLRVAFDKNGKFLQSSALEKTCLVFLKEDALTRWQAFLNEWESEAALELIVERLDTANEKRRTDPIPESLEANYKYLRDRAAAAESELAQYDALITEVETRFEGAIRKSNVGELFAVADKLIRRKNEIQQAPERWTKEQHDQITQFLNDASEALKATGAAWIAAQACNSPMQVSDFRGRMERNEKTLSALGLTQLVHAIAQQKQQAIASVEVRYQFNMAISEATDLSRLPDPNSNSRIREVRDSVDRAEKFIGVLNDARNLLSTAADIVRLIESLKAKQKLLRDFIGKRQDRISECFESAPATTQQAEEILGTLNQLKLQFVETKDFADIEARRLSVTYLFDTYCQLDRLDVGPDSISETFSSYINSDPVVKAADTAADDEEDSGEHEWIAKCIADYVACRYAAVKARSNGWATSALAEVTMIAADKSRLIRQDSLDHYLDLPSWLSSEDRETIQAKIETTRQLRENLILQHEEQEAKRWIEELELAVMDLEQMPSNQCLAILMKMENPPLRVDQEKFLTIRTSIQLRVDENDISDLVERIAKLSDKMKEALFLRLASAFPKESV